MPGVTRSGGSAGGMVAAWLKDDLKFSVFGEMAELVEGAPLLREYTG
jgi:hypothetical protein